MSTQAEAVASHHHQPAHGVDLAKLGLGAIGVVYGDIGTSPLYAIKECVTLPHGVAPVAVNIYGILSLIFWSITLVVSVKYLLYVMRADNDGEGGVLALMALVARHIMPELQPGASADESGAHRVSTRTTWTGLRKTRMILVMLGLFGAALLYGDGIITPAISVLSRGRGLGGRDQRVLAVHRPGHLLDPGGALRGAEARHRRHRRGVRAGDGGVVPRSSPPPASPGSCATPTSCGP